MSGYDDMARHVRDALEESEVQADGSCIIRPEHYLQLNADFEAWDEADDAKREVATLTQQDGVLDESSITDEQIEEALRHGFGDQAASELHRSTPVSGDEVERVARAIYDATHAGLSNCYSWDDAWEPYQEARRELYYKEARAAIAALHPTDPAAIRNAALEEAARVAEGLVAIARASKSHPHPLQIDTNEGWRRLEDGAQDIVDAIRGLVKEVG